MTEEQVPFDVTEEEVVGDLTQVKEQRSLVPAASNVKMRIAKAGTQINKDKDIKSLKIEVRIVDGIEVPVLDPETNQPTGESRAMYINKPMFTGFMDLVYFGNPNTRTGKWWKTKQHLVQFKKFCDALGFDLKDIKVNDAFLNTIIDAEVLVDIQHEEETAETVDGNTGEKTRKKLGTFRERLRNWKRLS